MLKLCVYKQLLLFDSLTYVTHVGSHNVMRITIEGVTPCCPGFPHVCTAQCHNSKLFPRMVYTMYMFLMRDEKEERKKERSKQGQTNKQGKATQHTQGSHSGGTRTHDTLYSRQSALHVHIATKIVKNIMVSYKSVVY